MNWKLGKNKKTNLKTKLPLGKPVKLKPTQVHKSKKSYNRKKEKRRLEKQIKIATD